VEASQLEQVNKNAETSKDKTTRFVKGIKTRKPSYR